MSEETVDVERVIDALLRRVKELTRDVVMLEALATQRLERIEELERGDEPS